MFNENLMLNRTVDRLLELEQDRGVSFILSLSCHKIPLCLQDNKLILNKQNRLSNVGKYNICAI